MHVVIYFKLFADYCTDLYLIHSIVLFCMIYAKCVQYVLLVTE